MQPADLAAAAVSWKQQYQITLRMKILSPAKEELHFCAYPAEFGRLACACLSVPALHNQQELERESHWIPFSQREKSQSFH